LARKNKAKEIKREKSNVVAKVHDMEVSDILETNYMPYTMSVIVSRALPEIDGLKPSHRKLLYTMYKMGLLKGSKTKSANIVGATMRLNPHGDQAIYETMVRLARGNESLLLPLVDSKGNFGKVYSRDMAFAAARYTEAKLEKVAQEFFKDIDKNTVDFIPNYDNTTTEPLLLPVTFPAILANPNMGIAVGMASNICSFNLEELCNATIEIIKSKGKEVDLIEILKAPDFPTGGELVYNKETIKRIYETGKGTFYLRAKTKYDAKNNCIEIYEIPYTTTIEAITESITELVKNNTIKELTDIRDETDKEGLKIVLDLKRGTDVEVLLAKLYKLTPMQSPFSCNFNIIINGSPCVLGVREIIEHWVDFRMDCVRRGLKFDIEKQKRKLHLLRGLDKVLLNLDKAVKIVKDTPKDKDVIKNLMEFFKIDEEQANYVADIKLRNFNKEYIINRTKDIGITEKEIARLEGIAGSDTKIRNIIIKELEEVAKTYGSPRKTTLISEKKIEIPEEIFVEDYKLKMYLSKEGYIKKVPLVSLRGNSEHKLKPSDYIVQEIETTNKADLLLFSNKQIVYKLKISEIEDTKLSSWGEFIPNLLELGDGEEIIHMVCTENYAGSVIYFFENGKTAKIDMKGYETKTNRKQLVNAYSKASPVVRMLTLGVDEDIDVVLQSNVNKILRVNTSKISLNTYKQSGGLNTMKLKKGEKVTGVYLLDEIQFEDLEYYTTANIPAVGKFLKKEDRLSK